MVSGVSSECPLEQQDNEPKNFGWRQGRVVPAKEQY
jgi:hypothetical protein